MAIDETTLATLVTAWQPDGDERMLDLILDAAIELSAGGIVAPVLSQLNETELTESTACKAAQILIDSGDATSALSILGDATDRRGIWRVRAHVALSQSQAAAEIYAATIRQNPTLEDPELAGAFDGSGEQLAVNVISIAGHLRSEQQAPRPVDGGLPAPPESLIKFSDVGGLENVKAQIRRKIITPFKKPSLFEKFRRKAGGGVLLYGPPGCGKTMLARATAGECEARFINIHIAEILDMYVGESEKRLAGVFENARRETPTVLFFDEIEALAGRRHQNEGDTKASIASTFLAELDGFESKNDGVLVLAATNMPWAVDPAFRRAGRFDRVQFVPPPDQEARRVILGLVLDGRPGAGSIDISKISRQTSGFSGADLELLVNTGADIAIEESLAAEKEIPMTMAHMAAALKETKATTLEWLTTARNYAKYSNTGGQYDEVAEFLRAFGK